MNRHLRGLASPALAALLLAGCAGEPPVKYAGNELYAGNCANCHGVYADGMGPAAPAIPQHVPDLRQIAATNGGVFPRELVTKIIDGRNLVAAHRDDVMPKWGDEFQVGEGYSKDAERRVKDKITALVDFLESIQIEAE